MKAEYITHSGDDLLVVNSARVSMGKHREEFEEDDKKLLAYLAKHQHWTPFSHPQITLREKVPIFVARQRFKHMVGFTYNEISRRYVDDEPEFYTPDVWRSRPEGSVKQGSGDDDLSGTVIGEVEYLGTVREHYESSIAAMKDLYDDMIKARVAPEQARMVLPQSMYTEYYVTGSLAAFARAYKQRIDSHAQKEIQDLAVEWDRIIASLFPESWEVLTND